MALRSLVRTDASLQIGSGHVMRCLCLAQALADRGVEVHFACRELAGNLNDVVTARGFPLHVLPPPGGAYTPPAEPPHARWLEVDPEQDMEECRALLETLGGVDILIVDHFALEAAWERALRPRAGRLLVLDDLADRRHDADIILNAGLGADTQDPYRGLLPPGCARLLGPRYALLRPEFAAARTQLRQRDGRLRRLFVFMGGVDAGGYTLRVLDALDLLREHAPTTDVLAGAGNPAADLIAMRCGERNYLNFHRNVTNLASLMAEADLAVGAAGATSWERACMGLPGVVLTVADNQRPLGAMLAAAGAAIVLDGEAATPQRIAAGIESLTPAQLRDMGAHCLELVDGRGVERLLRVLLPPPVVLRPAGPADRDPMLAWRNEAAVRKQSHCRAVISAEQHADWFEDVLNDPARALLIAELDGRAVGVLRYDCDGAEARASIYLAPGGRGRGYGPAMLRAGTEWLRRHRPETARISAEIRPGNPASRQAFAEAGYVPGGEAQRQELRL